MMGYTISKGIWLDSKPRSSLALPGYAKTMDFSNYAVSSFLPRNEEGLNFSLVLPCKKIKLAKTGETANCHSSGCSGTLHFSPTL